MFRTNTCMTLGNYWVQNRLGARPSLPVSITPYQLRVSRAKGPRDSMRCIRGHRANASHTRSGSRPFVRAQGNLTGITRAHPVSTNILHLRLSRAHRDKRHRFTIHSYTSLDCRNRLSRSVELAGRAGFGTLSRNRLPLQCKRGRTVVVRSSYPSSRLIQTK